jgi:hypothetical protein
MGAPRYTIQLPESDIERIIESLHYQARRTLDTYASELTAEGENTYTALLWEEYNGYVAIAHELESLLPE